MTDKEGKFCVKTTPDPKMERIITTPAPQGSCGD